MNDYDEIQARAQARIRDHIYRLGFGGSSWVAREIGVTPQRMSQITREQKAISLRTMCRLANVFEVPLSALLFDEEEA